MVYTGDTVEPATRRRCAVAIEPMTCPPNALRTGTDVIVLEPGSDIGGALGVIPSGVRKGVLDDSRNDGSIIVGAGFAGIGCAKELAKHDDLHVTLIDKHNYSQFMPLLYQMATAQLAPSDVALNIRAEFRKHPNVDVKMGEVVSVDTATIGR